MRPVLLWWCTSLLAALRSHQDTRPWAAAKGVALHRRSGKLFVGSMTIMGLLGALMAAISGVWREVNVPAGVLTVYFVLTAFTAVRPLSHGKRWLEMAGLMVALGIGLTCLTFGMQAIMHGGKRAGIPAFPFFLFGITGTIAGLQDMQVIRAAAPLMGIARLRWHLWRMSFALFVAAMSFFIGHADVIPQPYRVRPLLAIPALLPLAAMLYWLWRVRAKRKERLPARMMSMSH